jgi:pimeloyl-ACP methyl ester carboxylesterase
MGCSVSLEYLRRDGVGVDKLILVNGPIKLIQTPDFPWTMTEVEVDNYIDAVARDWPANERSFQRTSLCHPSEELVAWLTAIATQTPRHVVLKTVRAQKELDHRGMLHKLELPVLAIYSRHDPYYPTDLARFIAERVPNGRSLILEESGHYPFLEADCDRFNEAVAAFAAGGELAA